MLYFGIAAALAVGMSACSATPEEMAAGTSSSPEAPHSASSPAPTSTSEEEVTGWSDQDFHAVCKAFRDELDASVPEPQRFVAEGVESTKVEVVDSESWRVTLIGTVSGNEGAFDCLITGTPEAPSVELFVGL